MAPETGLLRLTRVACFAVSAVGLASAAHLAAGDDVPPLTALLAVPAVMLVVNLLAAGRRGPIGLFVGMGLTQVALHLCFMVTSLGSGCLPPQAMSAMGGNHGHAAVVCEAVNSQDATVAQLWPSASMALAHALASTLLVLALARGEAAVWALAACLRFRFLLPEAAVRVPVLRRLPVAVAATRSAPRPVHLRTVRRRGPPRGLGATVPAPG